MKFMDLIQIYHEILKKHKLPNRNLADPLLLSCLLSYNQLSTLELERRLRQYDFKYVNLKEFQEKQDFIYFLAYYYLFYYRVKERREGKHGNIQKELQKKSFIQSHDSFPH